MNAFAHFFTSVLTLGIDGWLHYWLSVLKLLAAF